MKRFLLALLALISAPLAAQTIFDGSGTLTTGGTAQVAFIANSNRSYLMVQNPIAATETLFVNIAATASTSAASYELAPGGSITFQAGTAPIAAVSVNAVTTGHRWVAKSW